MGIIQKTRPLVGQPNPEEELRLLEEKAKASYGAIRMLWTSLLISRVRWELSRTKLLLQLNSWSPNKETLVNIKQGKPKQLVLKLKLKWNSQRHKRILPQKKLPVLNSLARLRNIPEALEQLRRIRMTWVLPFRK